MKIKLYIPTCDKYNWLIQPFAYTFNKFWSEDIEVVYLGYTNPILNYQTILNSYHWVKMIP